MVLLHTRTHVGIYNSGCTRCIENRNMRVRAPGKRSRGPAEVQQTRAADAQSRRRQLQWLCVLFHYVRACACVCACEGARGST
jgi:hypothetical protein